MTIAADMDLTQPRFDGFSGVLSVAKRTSRRRGIWHSSSLEVMGFMKLLGQTQRSGRFKKSVTGARIVVQSERNDQEAHTRPRFTCIANSHGVASGIRDCQTTHSLTESEGQTKERKRKAVNKR